MNVKIKRALAETVGVKKMAAFGLTVDGWTWNQDTRIIDLARLSKQQVDELYDILKDAHTRHGVEKAPGVVAAWFNIDVWRKAKSGKEQRARTAEHAADLLKLYLQKVSGHRVFQQEENGTYLCYYVDHITFHKKVVSRDGVRPAFVTVHMVYEELGGQDTHSVSSTESQLRGKTPGEMLAAWKIVVESKELREAYVADASRFRELAPQIGRQLEAWGLATDDVDGNPKGDDDTRYYRQTRSYNLGSDDDSSRLVVDVFHEVVKEDRSERVVRLTDAFWGAAGVNTHADDDDDNELLEDDDEAAAQRIAQAASEVEVPVHPYLAAFHLGKHLRLRVHVSQVRPHVYDAAIADKLVLPEELKTLVSLLVEHKAGGFQDVVKNKSGGAVVLLGGPPGTGKTLTAEVYAESEERALYSVQCSQLGVDPEAIEGELLKCFARSSRWNAVMLLDEADVYIRRRGDDLNQNAIVGVFLRVLEYQQSVMFLTTNRANDVDDAIASRCIAKIMYKAPTAELQRRIWQTLAPGAGLATTSRLELDRIVAGCEGISGRDVKNLLKLASLVEPGKLTAKTVAYVKQFKPTADAAG